MSSRALAHDSDTHKALKGRRARRVGFIWLLAIVFIAGNLWDWFGGHSWGKAQSTNQSLVVHASAALFWLGLAMLSLCIRDLISILIHKSRPPTIEDLPEQRGWWDRNMGNPVRKWAKNHQALVGLTGLVAGALFGYFVWKP